MKEDAKITQSRIDRLSPMVRQYLVTALWSSNDESTPEGGEPFDANYELTDIDACSVLQAERDCKQFEALAEIAGCDFSEARDMGRVGHDFWLSRCGHGAGFFDGDYPIHGDKLQAIAETFGEVNPSLGDDGTIYFE
jgi:hypothetical protein